MSASAGDDVPTKQEIEQILYDPQLAKTQAGSDLAWKYLRYVDDEDPTQYGFKDRAEFEQWRDKVKRDLALSNDPPEDLEYGEDDVYDSYSHAKDIYDQSQANARAADKKAADDAKGKLDEQAGRASKTNAGANTSDEILNLGLPGMKTFDIWVPLFNRAVAVVGTYQPADKDDLYKRYDEQRKIPFTKFMTGADEFRALSGAVVNASTDVEGQLSTNLADWQGDAADQADNFRKNYTAGAKVVSDAGTNAAEAMKSACGAVGKACRDKANWVIKYRVDSLGPVTAQDLDRIIRIAELRSNASQDDFKHCAKFLDQQSQDMIKEDDCDLDDDTVNHIVDQCSVYLKDNFGKFFDGYVRDFKTMCSNTHDAVDGAWRALTDFFAQLPQDPFSNVDQAAPPDPGNTKPSSSSSSGGGGGSSGVPSGGGGGGGGGGAPSIPHVELPKTPQTPGALNPVTHQPLETDPETGKPYPIDPHTGRPIKTAEPETMTVQQGDHKIAMTEPGSDGCMGITVDDGTGHPKQYQLDFDDPKDAAAAAPGQPGQSDEAAQPGHPGQPAPAGGGQASGFGPQGHSGGQATDPSPKTYEPGPDGKIHIEDGGLKITAERPSGPDGPTVVTVDDGSGDPVKYTLGDDGKPDALAGLGQGGTAAQNGQGGLPDVPGYAADGSHTGDLGSPGRTGGTGGGLGGQDSPVSANGHEAAQQPVPAHAADAGPQHLAGLPQPDGFTADATGHPGSEAPADDSTTAQSLTDPLDSHSTAGAHHADALGTTPDAAPPLGGGAAEPSASQLGTAPTPADHLAQQPASMGMMGGAVGGAGGGGHDQARSSSAFRVDRGLFESSKSGNRISGSLDDDRVMGS
ncbi:hypothetical protein [Amycolatopsis sp. FDAARGOS 1241]|uniref:hypothetical protein n=1 Tax=Amycolatopsis sp. FDAARGOS 1241 TaxID=2778070 RepID=UPI001951DE7E|nr:hypothetical protein [Amycolatopsis sp. FDAARGOS 1241]QRP45348.1 hypothetical protein I6J71_40390 [Amycolatopsis sp. FDAARGOS 1241]